MEYFNRIILRACELEIFLGLKVSDRECVEEITHLFFAYDTLLLHDPSERILLHPICILLSFEVTSGLNMSW